MDYALELRQFGGVVMYETRFNPCFSGLCFGARREEFEYQCKKRVLILVLVDYALELALDVVYTGMDFSFNPCFSGLCFGALLLF